MERRAVLSIIVDAAKARRESRDLAQQIRNLDTERRTADKNAVSGNDAVDRSEQRRAKSTTSRITAGLKAAAQSRKNAAAAREEAEATAKLAPLQERVVAAQGRATKAALSLTRAREAQVGAEQRLQKAIKASGAESDKAAVAQQRHREAILATQSAQLRYTTALKNSSTEMQKYAAAQAQAGGGGRGFASNIKSLGNAMGDFVNKVGGAGVMLGKFLLPLSAIAAFIPTLVSGFSSLAAATTSLIGPLSQLGSLAGTLPQAFSVLGGAIGTLVAGFSGIGAAVKAGAQAQKEAGTTARKAASAQRQAARQITSAQRGLVQAHEAVEDAEKGVQRAREAAADSARQSAAAVRQAQLNVADAEWNLAEATKAVSEARKDAARQIDEMRDSLRDLDLQQRGATLSLAEAKERLNEVLLDAGSTDADKARAQLAVDEAVASLDSVQKQKKQARAELADAEKKGIKNSDQVVSALRTEEQAQRAVKEAQQAVSQARKDQARAARDSAESIAEAQEGVRDAQQAAADAAANLADAQASANDSMLDGADAASKYNQALADLSPAGKAFVALLLSLQGELKRLRFAAQEGLLPGIGEGLLTLTALLPLVERGLFRFGQIMGSTFAEAAKVVTSPEFMPVWNRLLESNLRIMEMLSPAAINLVKAVARILDAYRPLTEWLVRGFTAWTESVAVWAKGRQEMTLAGDSFARTRDVLSTLGNILGNIGKVLGNTGKAGMDLGFDLLHSFENITKGWADWTGSIEGQNRLKEWFDSAREPMHQLRLLIGDIASGFSTIARAEDGSGFADFIKSVRGLGPEIEALLLTLAKSNLDTAIVDMFGSLLKVFTVMSEAGILEAVADTLGTIADALAWILQYEAAQEVVKGLAVGMAVMGALKLLGVISGAKALFGIIAKAGPMLARFAKVLAKLGPLLAKIGPIFMKIAGIVAKAMLIMGRAMLANPWFLLIAGLIVIVVLVVKYWDQIKAAVMKAINWVIDFVKNNWDIIKWFLGPLGLLIDLVIKHWDTIKKTFTNAITAIVNFVKNNWRRILGYLTFPLRAAWTAIKVIWGLIKAGFSLYIRTIVKIIKTIWAGLRLLITTPLKLAWAGLKAIWAGIKWVFNHYVNLIKAIFTKVWAGFKFLIIDPIKAAWDRVGKIMESMRSGIAKAADKIKEIFRNLKTGIGTIWEGVTNLIKKPIKLAVDVVNKLVGGYNDIADKVPGVGRIPTIKGFAKGGVASRPGGTEGIYPGYTPGRDIGYIGISGGEAIMRPEWTRAIGAARINEMNRAARTGGVSGLRKKFLGGFAGGGIPASGTWSRHSSGYPWARWAGDINEPGSGDYGNPVRAYKSGTVASVVYLGDRSYGRYIRINHPGGERTLYAHLSAASVRGGQKVSRGQVIGRVGNEGNSSGPHLHFEIAGGSDPVQIGGDAGKKPTILGTLTGIFGKLGKGIKNVSAYFSKLVSGTLDKMPDGSLVKGIALSAKNGLSEAGQKMIEKITSTAASMWDKAKSLFPGGEEVAVNASGSVVSQVKAVAKQYGWGSGAEWNALSRLITKESGWNPNAANPTSSARGLFQKMTSIHGPVESTPAGQAQWGLNYIRGRYGSPSRALAFHNANNYYADGGVAEFNAGGKVPGVGYRDTVPALLTPGEFVIRKEAVRRIGVANLEAANGRAGQHRKRTSGPVQYFHSGGQVPGFRTGRNGIPVSRTKALEYLYGLPPDGKWDSVLSRSLQTKGSKYLKGPANPSRTWQNALVNFLNSGRKARSMSDVMRHFRYLNWSEMTKRLAVTMPLINKRVSKERRAPVQKANTIRQKEKQGWLLNLAKGLGLSKWDQPNVQRAMSHVIKHMYGRKHDAFEYRPWKTWSPVEAATQTQEAANAKQQNFQNALFKIATWGYEDLLNDLQSKGFEDDAAYNTALDAAKKQDLAKRLNDAIAKSTAFSDEDMSNILKIISFMMSQSTVQGLRDVARHLGMSDYSVVKLWEAGTKGGKFNSIPATRQSRMIADIAAYRRGTFYANSGGRVPGSGNRDTVPAMLTPGEFVLRKKAVEALGLDRAHALNNADRDGLSIAKFAAGGLVGSLTPVPTNARAGVSRRSLAGAGIVYNIHNNWDIDINNPVAEKSSKTLTKALQRQSALGAPGSTVNKEVA